MGEEIIKNPYKLVIDCSSMRDFSNEHVMHMTPKYRLVQPKRNNKPKCKIIIGIVDTNGGILSKTKYRISNIKEKDEKIQIMNGPTNFHNPMPSKKYLEE